MSLFNGRALHFVFKVGNRTLTSHFYRDILGMKVLRHEEFKEGCDAQCNGPYDNRWSKTMVGYGSEDTHFVIELTYNYGVAKYDLGNDFLGITLRSDQILSRASAHNWEVLEEDGMKYLESPDGYKFYIIDVPKPADKDPVEMVTLACTDVGNSVQFWNGILTLKVFEKNDESALLGFDEDQTKLRLVSTGGKSIDHGTAYGRIAFSVPTAELHQIEASAKQNGHKILTPLISLDTPGKATVTVVILADPDGHEICFVGDENFRKLSEVDPESTAMLDKYIKLDEKRKGN